MAQLAAAHQQPVVTEAEQEVIRKMLVEGWGERTAMKFEPQDLIDLFLQRYREKSDLEAATRQSLCTILPPALVDRLKPDSDGGAIAQVKSDLQSCLQRLGLVEVKMERMAKVDGIKAAACSMSALFLHGAQPHASKSDKWTSGPHVDRDGLSQDHFFHVEHIEEIQAGHCEVPCSFLAQF
mmetsp:Transcript_12429/g.21980  ORF Transcript_12429/g.21980 Transcript_12429/m.21980 type:complete len:181 (-) Transcript_12429:393-935(-)|eukprot:CAMPEP_0119101208 /NCGR_PEP_ID=MMETSP1180-20130426/324_1 /TAXON_ID=3052 ORGANISM="Chlamydomonas cf sp, Strain CCMP681" /NCGR_SAMPLE_ID=MMETSP1180 /ASSEMBLY_ACC=CAM_ASM_000741 /LENGTH=180 /DNA_ID=CAMNT_0007085293 /DNA_START=144 /DNA_END=686 /DNA_ORIENTATION=-